MKRKDFLKMSGVALGSVTLPDKLHNGKVFPIMISTWDSGMRVNEAGWKILSAGGTALDAIEAGGNYMEDQNDCCVGLNGYPDRDGIVTLDASIMDHDANCGSVAALEQIKHPISVARKVMEKTPHVFLAGAGAQQFALENGFNLEPKTLSAGATKAYADWLKNSKYAPVINIENKKQNGPFAPYYFEDGSFNHDTMGMLSIDSDGKLAGGVTTSGMAFKVHGRLGDSPVIGAGLFVDKHTGAATSSGVGEEVIRICGTHLVVEFLRQGYTPEHACKKACQRIIDNNPAKAKTLQVGFVAVDKNGRYGAYSLQKGFVYAVRSRSENRLYNSKYFFG